MSRFLVTNGVTFEPFSFEELIKPLAYKQERHDAAQEVYDKLSMDTEALGHYIKDNEDDREAKALYDSYREKLASLQENLWNNGVTAQTRRDLSAARAGYANDIQRLGKAIESRQARSKEYWDNVHKNPDLIVGIDPGTYGLDKYLNDDNFGSNWFSYSGDKFMSEVGADAKARALEMRRNIQQEKEVPGYITRIAQQGFTNDEVEKAISAVRDGSYPGMEEGAEKILATTLADHISATGAIKGSNISDEQYDRFFGYGRTGLSQGIFAPDVKDFRDVEDEYRRNVAIASSRAHLDKDVTPAGGYTDSSPERLESPEYDKYAKYMSRVNKSFRKGSKVVYMPDGSPVEISNKIEGSAAIYDTPSRRAFREAYGVDVALDASNFFGTTDSRQTFSLPALDSNGKASFNKDGSRQTITVTTRNLKNKDADSLGLNSLAKKLGLEGFNDFVGLYDKNGKLRKEETKIYNDARIRHFKAVSDVQKNNPDLRLSSVAMTPEQERRLREGRFGDGLGIPATASISEADAIMRSKYFTEHNFTPATLVSVAGVDDALRKHFVEQLNLNINNIIASDGKGNKLPKGSNYTIKKLGKGLMSEEGEIRDLGSALGTNKNGDIVTDNFNTVTFNPYDIAEDPKNPSFRFTTKNGKDVYKAKASLLGDFVNNILTAPEYNGKSISDNSNNGVYSASDAVKYMMLPLTDAGRFSIMPDSILDDWWQNTCAYLGNTYNPNIDPSIFISDSEASSELYSDIVRYIDDHLVMVKNAIAREHPQAVGNTGNNIAYSFSGR